MAENQKVNEVFQQYNTNCPFELARYLKIEVDYHDFPKHIYGLYSPKLSTAHILINKYLSLEKQEKVCDHLVAHHIIFDNHAEAYCIEETTLMKFDHKEDSSSPLKKMINPITE